MSSATIIYLGLDVHKESVTIAVLPRGAIAPTRVERLPNDLAKLRRFRERLRAQGEVRACYEASGAGYVIQRAMATWGQRVRRDPARAARSRGRAHCGALPLGGRGAHARHRPGSSGGSSFAPDARLVLARLEQIRMPSTTSAVDPTVGVRCRRREGGRPNGRPPPRATPRARQFDVNANP